MGPAGAILIAALLLLIRSLSLAADAALGQISHERATELATQGRSGQAVLAIKSAPESPAAALRAWITFPLVFAAGLAVVAGTELAVPPWASAWVPSASQLFGPLVGALGTAVATTVTDLAGRSLGAAYAERVALPLARPIRLAARVLAPLLRSAGAALEMVLAPFGVKVRFAPPAPPLEEIERLLAEEAGRRLDQKAPALIRSIFELSEKSAREVMIPRTEIIALDLSTRPQELIRVLQEEGHSRLPVFRDDIDHIVGVLHARDLVPLIAMPHLIVLQDLIRPATFVPWSKPIGDLLREMQKRRIHMAMVVDEYGGFMGLITLEDILEEIVGELGNEYAEEEAGEVEPLPDGSFLVLGTIALQQLNQVFSVEIPEGEYETLGGYLNSLAGAIPEVGDRFFFAGLQFTVNDRSPKQVRRVRVARVKKPTSLGERAGSPEPH